MKNNNIEVTVMCGQESLAEYDRGEEEDGTRTAIIPSREGEVGISPCVVYPTLELSLCEAIQHSL